MSRTLLVADDSVTIQKVVELTFSESDLEVVAVGTGRQALEAVESLGPVIVLCDVIMPELNGYEVCGRIKSDPRTAGIPVLLLTGAFEPFDEARAEKCGADGHLTKPFESRALLERVEALLTGTGAPARSPVAEASRPAPPPAPAATESAAPGDEVADAETSFGDIQDWLDDESASAEPGSVPDLHEDPFDEEALTPAAASGAAGPITLEDDEPAAAPVVAPSAAAPEGPATAAVSSVVALTSDALARALSDPDLREAALAAIERVAREVVREVAWEIVPDLTAAALDDVRRGGDR